jgi:hypothetical protein
VASSSHPFLLSSARTKNGAKSGCEDDVGVIVFDLDFLDDESGKGIPLLGCSGAAAGKASSISCGNAAMQGSVAPSAVPAFTWPARALKVEHKLRVFVCSTSRSAIDPAGCETEESGDATMAHQS